MTLEEAPAEASPAASPPGVAPPASERAAAEASPATSPAALAPPASEQASPQAEAADEAPLPTLLTSRAAESPTHADAKEEPAKPSAAEDAAIEQSPRLAASQDVENEEAADSDDEEAAEANAQEAEAEEAEAQDSEAEREALKRAAESEAYWSKAVRALKDRERREKVQAFLKAHGYTQDVNESKGWLFSYTYPLHSAAKRGNAEMARLLLESKAIRRQRDSDGRTARKIAKKMNVMGSHAEVIKILTRTKRVKKDAGASKAKATSGETASSAAGGAAPADGGAAAADRAAAGQVDPAEVHLEHVQLEDVSLSAGRCTGAH